MKRGLIVAPARLTALAVFNSGTLRLQCSTAAHCACSVQQRHTALAVFNSGILHLQYSTAAYCACSIQQRHTSLAVVQHKQDIHSTLHWKYCSTNKTYMAHCAGSSATQSKTYIAPCTGKWCKHKQVHSTLR